MQHGITRKEYLWQVVNRNVPTDGLFVWLSIHVWAQHINIIHPGGIWSSRLSEVPVLTDATVILVLHCFLTSLKMTLSDKKEDSFYVMPLLDPREVGDCFVPVPKVLNCPVHDVDIHLEEVGMYMLGPQVPIQNSLADLLECSVTDYREQIYYWLHDSAPELPMVEKWIVIRGMNLQVYLDLLTTGVSVDGLELWVASLAMNTLISVIMEDSIWSTD